MLNCEHLISSHVDVPVHDPPALRGFRRRGWKFTFLQHGVIKDDLSRWLNPKNVDLFVTSTPDELESIAGDDSPYVYSANEVKLTGLPRFDTLQRAAQRHVGEDADVILLAPTWRHWLVGPLDVGSQRRTMSPQFFESQFAEEWLGLIRSTELRDLAAQAGKRLYFLPHPNLLAIRDQLDLPDHIQLLTYEDRAIHDYFARTAALVTDYSSMAFNAAYLRRAVVYFQFDRDTFLSGGHVGRAGYFDYETKGFGPVARTRSEVLRAVADVIANDSAAVEPYASRIEETFPFRDGRCCERVTLAIESLRGHAGDSRRS